MHLRGFTLIELVVAVTVLAVGVLAVAANAVPLARLVRRGGVQTGSAAAAGAEIESLRAAGCAAPATGTVTSGGGYRLRWSVAPAGRLREVTVVTTYPWGSGARSDVYETAVACPR
jgi:prepilin-type N-terminal cleavage/methylation domain-containing protein